MKKEVLGWLTPEAFLKDINKDGKTGTAEVIYMLRGRSGDCIDFRDLRGFENLAGLMNKLFL